MAEINNKKLKTIGYVDLISTISIIIFVFLLIIGLFNSEEENEDQLELNIKLLPVKKVGLLGYLAFYSSTFFLSFVGIYAILSSCMLIKASNLQVNNLLF